MAQATVEQVTTSQVIPSWGTGNPKRVGKPTARFTIGQELTAARDHGLVPARSRVRVARVMEYRPGEFSYLLDFGQGRSTTVEESSLRFLVGTGY